MAAIHFASQKGHIQIVRVLLAAGASVSSRTRKGMTPLHYAVQGSHKDLIKLLVKRGANVSAENKAGKRPLDLAKDQSIIELLETTATEQRSNKRAKEKGGAGGTNEESEKEPCPEALDKIDEKVQAFGQSGTTCEPLKLGRRNKDLSSTEDDRDVEDFSPKQKKSKIALSHLFQDSDGDGEAA
ncbi:hypothetical protein O6H91_16G003700 [Diphasiastrum complanatum]|nr:hypothetical protein O6H91_16G003000 [Diphasiastrum complanatum]KAJ7526371.1 hypothetical protein O6H91_16G003700 [Diphasiastrum complanatum]